MFFSSFKIYIFHVSLTKSEEEKFHCKGNLGYEEESFSSRKERQKKIL